MKQIPLTKGKFALVDDEDFIRISARKWYSHSMGYAVTTEPRPSSRKLLMHRIIMGDPLGMEIDHKNCNRLDNRKENLRVCYRNQNAANTSKPKHAWHSKYKGVTWFERDLKWKAQLGYLDKNLHLGYFDREEDAATAYNFAADKYFGEFAKLNEAA